MTHSLLPPDDESSYIPVEQALAPILRTMEKTGIRVSPRRLDLLLERKTQLVHEMRTLAKYRLDPDNLPDLKHVFFDRLRLTSNRTGQTGPALNLSALEWLATQHPLAGLVLQYRTLLELITAYVTDRPLLMDTERRFHFTFTMRWSLMGRIVTDPVLPDSSPVGLLARQGFRAAKDWQLLRIHFIQPAMRVMAHDSGDANFLHACTTDAHATVAEAIGITRDQAKALNYATVHGIGRTRPRSSGGAHRPQAQSILAHGLRVSPISALEWLLKYYTLYPDLLTYQDRIMADARAHERAVTLAGRIRPLPYIATDTRRFHQRFAFAFRIYGSVADLMKSTLEVIARTAADQGLQARPLLQFRDEILFEAPAEEIPALTRIAQGALTDRYPATITTGSTWAEVTESLAPATASA